MILEGFPVGPIQANCYIVGEETSGKGVVIDPGDEAERILGRIREHDLTIEVIFNTHGHFDHVGGNKRLKEATGAQIAIHPEDAHYLSKLSESAAVWGMFAENSPPPDMLLEDGQIVEVGGLLFKVLHTPGHTPGSVSLLLESARLVFTGDLIFMGSIGRTDFPGGDYATLINSVRTKIFTLEDDFRILSGHGPVTTVGNEKRYNPFFT